MTLKKAIRELNKIQNDFECITKNMNTFLTGKEIAGYNVKINALEAGIDTLCSVEFLAKEKK